MRRLQDVSAPTRAPEERTYRRASRRRSRAREEWASAAQLDHRFPFRGGGGRGGDRHEQEEEGREAAAVVGVVCSGELVECWREAGR